MDKLLRYITEDDRCVKIWLSVFVTMGTISGLVVGIMFWDQSLPFLQNILPIVTTPIGFSCVYLLGNGKNSGNTMGFLSNISEGLVNFMYGNFGLFISVIYYGVTHILGLFDWSRNRGADGRVPVKGINSRQDWIVMIGALVLSTLVTYLMYVTGNIPFNILSFEMIANVAVMYLGILAQGLMILRYKFAWWVWVILNVIAIPLNFMTGNAVFAIMYCFYLLNALITLYYQYVILPENALRQTDGGMIKDSPHGGHE